MSEAAYLRNRNVAIVGKVLTVIAPILFAAAVVKALEYASTFTVPRSALALGLSARFTGIAGRLTWAIADLRITKRLAASGVRIRRGAAIASMIAASLSCVPYVNIVAAPATWIAGAKASSRIREAHDQLAPEAAMITPYGLQTGRGFSTGFTLKF